MPAAQGTEVVREHAHWRNLGMEAHWDAAHASPLERVGDAISGWAADPCNEALGQELSADEEKFHKVPVNATKERELAAWKRFRAFGPLSVCAPAKAIMDTRW